MKNNKGIALILIILVIVGILALGGEMHYFLVKKILKPVACTQEAKVCLDGSTVSRTGPNCEFAQCPTATNQNQTGCNTNNDCSNGASCMVEGPLIANQLVHKVCVPRGQVVPL